MSKSNGSRLGRMESPSKLRESSSDFLPQARTSLRGTSNKNRETRNISVKNELGSVSKVTQLLSKAHSFYNDGNYRQALECCNTVYDLDAYRTDNLLLLSAIHFQLRNYSESIFYNQQCIRVDANFAEAYSNLGNALKELGDLDAATQFYLKAIKLKPRYCDAYNNLASTYVQLGRTKEAIDTFELAISMNPGLVDAHSNLGNLLKATGDFTRSKKCYLEAIRLKPDFAIAWNNLAGVMKEEGQIDAAIQYYKEAIRLIPDFADAHSNLGNAYRAKNQIQEAYECYKVAVKLRPDFAIARGNLATCLLDFGDVTGAIREFKESILLEPNFPDAHNNLGNALKTIGKLDEAIESYRSALRLKPDHPYAYNNLGNALKDKFLFKEAIHCYVTAIRLMPNFSPAHSNLASLFKEQGKLEQAIAHYSEAITLDPNFPDAYSNLGNLYKDIGRVNDAVTCYEKAISLRPKYAEAYSNLASVYKDIGRLHDAISNYEKALEIKPELDDATANMIHLRAMMCDWTKRESDLQSLVQLLEKQIGHEDWDVDVVDGSATPKVTKSSSLGQSFIRMDQINLWKLPSIQPFHSLLFPLSLSELCRIAKRYSKRAKLNVSLAMTESNAIKFTYPPKSKSSRLKVGYVSSDFGNHPIGHAMRPVFGLHDRSSFEVVCYSLTESDRSLWRDQIEQEAEVFKDVSSLNSSEIAQLIHEDGIHILVNLNGFSRGGRMEIFAMRPAPIQISFLGFSGTLGADYIDYLVADPMSVPTDLRSYYFEKILSLPHTCVVNDHRQSYRQIIDRADMPSRQKYGLSEDSFVFCNFGPLWKIDPKIFDTWMNILKRVPNSVLWLLRHPSEGETYIRSAAREKGVRDDTQIVFCDVVPKEEHIKRGFLADLYLDTPEYNASNTACDILWSGTPLLTMKKDKMASRMASSLLLSAGLDGLITSSYQEYEETAFSLALDPNRLYAMRMHLETNRDTCAAFDTSRWVKNFENGLLQVWKRRESGQSPDHIQVEDSEPVYTSASDNIFNI